MEKNDTVKLLRDCDAGIKMGLATLDEVKNKVVDSELQNRLNGHKREYDKLEMKVQDLLEGYGDEGKDPNPLAKGMAWLKTKLMLITAENPDAAIADLVTEGCYMGIKSINRYLNEYGAADESAKSLAKDLVNLSERQTVDLRRYL